MRSDFVDAGKDEEKLQQTERKLLTEAIANQIGPKQSDDVYDERRNKKQSGEDQRPTDLRSKDFSAEQSGKRARFATRPDLSRLPGRFHFNSQPREISVEFGGMLKSIPSAATVIGPS